MAHLELGRDFLEHCLARGEDSTQQATAAQLRQPSSPSIGRASQPLEDSGQLRRDPSLAVAKKPPGVIDQEEIAPQRESREHPFTRRIEVPPVLDRAQPERLFQAAGHPRSGHTSFRRGHKFRGAALRPRRARHAA